MNDRTLGPATCPPGGAIAAKDSHARLALLWRVVWITLRFILVIWFCRQGSRFFYQGF